MAIKTRRFMNSRKSCSCSMTGVWRAVAYMHGVVVIFHSPKACAHIARNMEIYSDYRNIADQEFAKGIPVPLLSSLLEEKHAIFGGADRLQSCISFAMRTYHPKCIVLANSCVAGVIGDDVVSAAREIEAEYHIPVLTVDCYGFLDGEYHTGYYEITDQLIDRFIPNKEEAQSFQGADEQTRVVLLGDNNGPSGQYAVEVTRLLGEMGIDVIGQFPGYMAFDDLPNIASASATIILGGRGQTHVGLTKIAEHLQKKVGMPFINIYPVGWRGTCEWILAVGNLLGKKTEAQALIANEKRKIDDFLNKTVIKTSGKRILICIGRTLSFFDPKSIMEYANMLQLDVQGFVMLDWYAPEQREEMVQAIKACTDVPIYTAQESDALMQTQDLDLIFTTHELDASTCHGIKQLFVPMLSDVGTEGAISFMQGIYRTLCSRQKGGIVYV